MLFRVALALFRAHEKELLQLQEPTECTSLLRQSAAAWFDSDRLVKSCFDKKLRRLDGDAGDAYLQELRARHGAIIAREHQESNTRRNEYNARKKQREQERAAAAAAAAAAAGAAAAAADQASVQPSASGEPRAQHRPLAPSY
jgi:hypothetical protein